RQPPGPPRQGSISSALLPTRTSARTKACGAAPRQAARPPSVLALWTDGIARNSHGRTAHAGEAGVLELEPGRRGADAQPSAVVARHEPPRHTREAHAHGGALAVARPD